MAENSGTKLEHDQGPRHWTTRRGFVSVMGFSVVSLYGLWAGYGAAPVSLSGLASEEGGGHGMAGMGGGMSPDEFRELANAFFDASRQPDGSIRPVRMAMAGMDMDMAEDGHDEAEDGHDELAEVMHVEGDEHTPEEHAEAMEELMEDGHDELAEVMHVEGDEHAPEEHPEAMEELMEGDHDEDEDDHDEDGDDHGPEPIDVYMLAERYFYEPSVLRLERGVPYNFRMMAMETGHGASIVGGGEVSVGGHMVRLPGGQLAERELTFTKAGEYLVYCTVYCGEGHEFMTATIIVEEPMGDMA